MRSNVYQSSSEQEIIMELMGLFVNRISMVILSSGKSVNLIKSPGRSSLGSY